MRRSRRGKEKRKRLKERRSGWIIDTLPRCCSSSLGPRRLSAALLPNFSRPL